MILESQLPRRRVLQLGGIVALSPLLTDLVASRPAAAAGLAGSAFRAAAAPITVPDLSPKSLWYRLPATDWQSQALPIGNARLGAMLYGAPEEEVVQFNEQSLWGGVNNYDNALMGQPDGAFDTGMLGFGSYRDFGALRITFAARPKVTSPGGPYQISGSETLEKTYDGNAGTKWCIIAPPASVQWQAQLPEATVVTSYTLTSANDVPARDPQDWVFAGSVDGSAWVTLDTRHIAPFEQRLQAKQFTFANADAYRYYRFVFTPKPGVSHFQVGEVALGGVSLTSGTTVYVSSPSGHAAGASAGADITRTVDNDAATAWRVDEPGDGVQWQLDLPAAHAMTSYRLQARPRRPGARPSGLGARSDGERARLEDPRHQVGWIVHRPRRGEAIHVRELDALLELPTDVHDGLADHAAPAGEDRLRERDDRHRHAYCRRGVPPGARPGDRTPRDLAMRPSRDACCARRSRVGAPTSSCCATRRTPPRACRLSCR